MSYSIRSYKSPQPFLVTSSNFICPSKQPVSTRKNMISKEMTSFQGAKFNEKTHTQTEFQDPIKVKNTLKQVQEQLETQKKLIREELLAQRQELENKILEGKLTLDDIRQMDEIQEADIMAYITRLEEEVGQVSEDREVPFVKTKINRARLEELNGSNSTGVQADEQALAKTKKLSNEKTQTKI